MTAEAISDKPSSQIVSLNPATLEELVRLPIAGAEEVSASVSRARAAQPAWASLSIKERARYMLTARRALCDKQDQLVKLISEETGKPEFEALSTEVFPIAELLSYYAANSAKILRDEKFTLSVFRNKRSMIRYEPLGVVGVISPWNFPFSIPAGEVVMALMAGNAVVLKPSEYTPMVGEAIWRLFTDAGLPAGLIEVVQGDGSTGAALVDSQIDKLFFTGSVSTGKAIALKAASRLLPVVLELGGKDPMIVCNDAPFERAVNGAVWGAFANCGQVCASVERLYVMEPLADRFISAVVAEVKKLRLGTDIGPLTNERQLRIVADHVADAVSKGARILVGGRNREDLNGYFYEPTILVNVNDSMRVMTEETFGPVLPIVRVENETEAIREANNSPYGLLASVWTSSNARGRRLAEALEAGSVIINDVLYTHGAARTPWFGVKQSGIGVTHGRAGLLEFSRMKHVNWDLTPIRRNWWWYPYSERWVRRFRWLMKVLYRWGFRRIV